MKNNKLTNLVLILTLAVSFVPSVTTAYSQSTAVDYLKSQSLDEWAVMALSAAGSLSGTNYTFLKSDPGSRATDIEKRILAIAAAGENPASYGSGDLIEKLALQYNGTEINAAGGLLNDDIFGLLAFSASKTKSDARTQLASFIKQNQNADGGWGYARGVASDSNITAMAIMALVSQGESVSSGGITKAFDYLAATKTSTGYSYDAISGYGADSASTSWVISAYLASGKTAPSSAVDYLKNLQLSSGAFPWQAGSSASSIMTSYALVALSGKFYPVGTTNSSSSLPSFSVKIVNGQTTIFAGTVSFDRVAFTDASGAAQSYSQSVAIGTLTEAAKKSGFSYVIKNTSLGLYVDSVSGTASAGDKGWLYAVNGVKPSVSAASYVLQNNDKVIWFYGGPNDPVPTDTGSNTSASISLSVNIEALPPPPPPPSIVFGIDTTSLNFGTLKPGEMSATKSVKLTNSGTADLKITTTLDRANQVYSDGLYVTNVLWNSYRGDLSKNSSKNVDISLKVPASYASTGNKIGTLIFWAEAR